MIGIYCIENIKNNKKYIGQSTDINRRFYNHKTELNNNNHRNQHLQNSWNKNGESYFKFFILEECKENKLDEKEEYWFSKYNVLDWNRGYNIKEPKRNGKHSPESKNKMSKSRTGKNHSLKTRERMSLSAKGKVFSREHRENISKNHFDISKENNPNFGKKIKGASSSFYGVYFHKKVKRWVATTCVNGKSKHIGCFEEEVLAAKAYDAFIIKNSLKNPLNFPEGGK